MDPDGSVHCSPSLPQPSKKKKELKNKYLKTQNKLVHLKLKEEVNQTNGKKKKNNKNRRKSHIKYMLASQDVHDRHQEAHVCKKQAKSTKSLNGTQQK